MRLLIVALIACGGVQPQPVKGLAEPQPARLCIRKVMCCWPSPAFGIVCELYCDPSPP